MHSDLRLRHTSKLFFLFVFEPLLLCVMMKVLDGKRAARVRISRSCPCERPYEVSGLGHTFFFFRLFFLFFLLLLSFKQHQGYGMLLMEEAERIARFEHKSEKILVIAGVGTRNYYRKMGYELDGPYMSKMLTEDNTE